MKRYPLNITGTVIGMAIGLLGVQSSAQAQKTPTFKYGDQAEVKDVQKVEWKASAQASLIWTSGNSETTTVGGGANASRKAGNNKLSMEAAGAYTRSTLFIVQDVNANGMIEPDEITRVRQTTTKSWLLRGRYDRFLTTHNSLYGMVQMSADTPAGKELVVGGQLGYSRQLFKNERHEVVSEVGYDYSYENQTIGDGVSIHSMRGFVGYQGKLTKVTGVIAAAEVLANVNSLNDQIGPLEDTRVNSSVALTTAIFTDINLRFGVSAKYDHAPALNPITTLPAEKLDTKVEAVLVVNFL